MLVYLLCSTVFLFLVLYAYLQWETGYFRRRGIKSLPFRIPFIGHLSGVFFNREHITEMIQKHYNAFPEEKYVGIRQFNTSLLQIRDLNLVKLVLVKDFDHFQDHVPSMSDDTDSILSNCLFAMRGKKWHDMRSTLSPAFTSLKMRSMFQFMTETSEQMVDHLKKRMKEQENAERGLVEAQMKDVFTRFASDIIASAVFGIKVNSLEEENNEFYQMSNMISNFSGWVQVKMMLCMIFPFLSKVPKFSILDEKVKDFFQNLVKTTMKVREEQNIVRPDMIHLLMEARKGSLRHETSQDGQDTGFATVEESHVGRRVVKRAWSDEEIAAQAVTFLIAGFEAASTLFCFMSHELAINQDIQKKLQREVDDLIAEKASKKLEYDDLIGLKYMDMVVTETMRKWPGGMFLDRYCLKPYKLPPSSGVGEGYTIQPGEGLSIPVYAFHHDPKYYPNPEKFDPERFSDENKHRIVPLSFMPFGAGPRNCIGNRFALMEAKAVMFYMLANFDFVTTAKTVDPVRLKKVMFNLTTEDGFWIGLKPRN